MADKQLFLAGDLVRVAKDLGPSMSHFRADCDAIVVGSYADQFGGQNRRDYTLYLKGGGRCSWYPDSCLTLIERGRKDLLKQWEAEADAEAEQKSDLDWIFAHGAEVIASPHGATIESLGRTLGINNLWGSRGEGITYFFNACAILDLARPYLDAADKAGWLEFARTRRVATPQPDAER